MTDDQMDPCRAGKIDAKSQLLPLNSRLLTISICLDLHTESRKQA